VIVRLDAYVVMGDQHLVVADDGADGGALRQYDLVKPQAHHLGGTLVTVGNGLDGLGRAPAQDID